MKKLLGFCATMLAVGVIHAAASAVAVVHQTGDELVLPMTLTNQAGSDIITESELISAPNKQIVPQGFVSFDVKLSSAPQIKHFRYSNKAKTAGCDFVVVVSKVGMMPATASIGAVPMSLSSSCSVSLVGGANLLAVGFMG